MISSFVVSLYLFGIPNALLSAAGISAQLPIPSVVTQGGPSGDAWIMLITVAITTVVWITTTLLTKPEPQATLEAFYRRVRPGGPGWAPISRAAGFGREPIPGGALAWSNWVAGIIAVYTTLFGIGKLVFGELMTGLLLLGVAVLAFLWIARSFRMDPGSPPERVAEPAAVAAD